VTKTSILGVLDKVSLFMVIYSLVNYTLETSQESDLVGIETPAFWISVFFAAEYVARLCLIKEKKQYAKSFLGIVDLLSFLPIVLSLGSLDTRFLHVIRTIRLIKIAKIMRYDKALSRLILVFFKVKDELIIFILLTMVALYLASVGIFYFESSGQPETFGSIGKCLWWALVTLTTVGYGDAIPMTEGGRLFTGLVLIIGVGLVSVPSGLFAAALSATKKENA